MLTHAEQGSATQIERQSKVCAALDALGLSPGWIARNTGMDMNKITGRHRVDLYWRQRPELDVGRRRDKHMLSLVAQLPAELLAVRQAMARWTTHEPRVWLRPDSFGERQTTLIRNWVKGMMDE